MAGPKDPIFGRGVAELGALQGRINDIANRIDGLSSKMLNFAQDLTDAGERAKKATQDIANGFDKASKSVDNSSKSFGKLKNVAVPLLNIFDSLGKGLIKLNASIIGLGTGLLIAAVQRIYELKERWAEATGLLNMKLGALTPNIKTLTRTANSWRGTVRGLTDDFRLGAQLFTEYATTLETTGAHVEEFNKLGLQLARGFDLGGKGAGNLVKAFRAMGFNAGETTKHLGNLAGIAGIKGVDVNLQEVVKDLAEAGDFMAEFGRSGQKTLIQSTVYLKQFNLTLKDTVKFMGVWDTFDSATEATGRLNTIFGTTISSMDMLLKQDPAERFEAVRQSLLAQGKTYENLTRYERKSLADTLKIGEQEIAFMLDRSKANISYADFKKKAADAEVKERDAQKLMQSQLQSTVQTLFAFGQAMDEVTLAIAKALRPLFEEIGLVEKGSDEWSGFTDIMKSVTKQLVKFFEALAKSKEWENAMRGLGRAIKSAAKWVASLTQDDLISFFDSAISKVKTFMKWSQYLIGAWAAGKVAAMIFNLVRIVKLTGKLSGLSRLGGLLGGGALGPMAAIAGVAAGIYGIYKLVDSISFDKGAATGRTREQDVVLKQQKELDALDAKLLSTKRQTELFDRRINAQRKYEDALMKTALIQKKKGNNLTGEELRITSDLSKGLLNFGISSGIGKKRLDELSKGAEPTTSELKRLAAKATAVHDAADATAKKLNELAGAAETMAAVERARAINEGREAKIKLNREMAIIKLREIGEKDLAEEIEKKGVTEGMAQFQKSAQKTRETLDFWTEKLSDLEAGRVAGLDDATRKQQIAQAKKAVGIAKEKNIRDEKIHRITGGILNTDMHLNEIRKESIRIEQQLANQRILQAQLAGFMLNPEQQKALGEFMMATTVSGEAAARIKLMGLGAGEAASVAAQLKGSQIETRAIAGSNMARGSARRATGIGGGGAAGATNYARENSDAGPSSKTISAKLFIDGKPLIGGITRLVLEN